MPRAIDVLVHCAGVVDEDFAHGPDLGFRMAVGGTEALVGAAVAAGASRLIYVSTAHVYGPMIGRKDERSPVDPRSDYALAHYASEQIFKRHVSESVAAVALRPCAVFGDLPDPAAFRRWSLIPFAFPREAVTKRQIAIRSSGQQRRNFVGTEDIAETVARWLAREVQGWSVINPVGASSLSVVDFAHLCAAIASTFPNGQVKVSFQHDSGPSPGEGFTYETLYDIARGRQDLKATTASLIAALGRL